MKPVQLLREEPVLRYRCLAIRLFTLSVENGSKAHRRVV